MNKPFNLLDAINGAKVQTKSGKPVGQLTHFRANGKYTVYGVVEGMITTWTEQGVFNEEGSSLNYDLEMAPEIVTKWVNVYLDDGDITVGGETYESKADAMINVFDDSYITTTKIEFEV